LPTRSDPGDIKKAQKAAATEETETFAVVAREWYAKFSPGWAVSHSNKIIRRLELYVFPWLGNRLIKAMMAPDLLAVLRRIEVKGVLETAHRTQQNCGQIFRYAVATGRAARDPSGDLRGAIRIPSMDIKAVLLLDVPCNWRRWFLFARGNFGMPNGRRSISRRQSVGFRRKR
jgi:integrase